MSMRIGSGIDIHPFRGGDQRPLILAGVTVRDAGGLAGHSDADVVAHAVADALLGAVALGDLGSHFGIDRPELAGADSLSLLSTVVTRLRAAGSRPVNVDCTVVAQVPRLGDFRDGMRANLARALEVEVGAVSVKFTTTDELGTIGRGEGIACWATALVEAVTLP